MSTKSAVLLLVAPPGASDARRLMSRTRMSGGRRKQDEPLVYLTEIIEIILELLCRISIAPPETPDYLTLPVTPAGPVSALKSYTMR
jgi:hypothetical protein